MCKLDELEVGKLREVKYGDKPCVVVKEKDGTVRALSGKCTHYGASLATGSYADGLIRCPWHGACFNASTGDIEDFPGLDSLLTYDVQISDDGQVKIRAPKKELEQTRRTKMLSKRDSDNQSTIIVVGGGAAGQVIKKIDDANRFSGFFNLSVASRLINTGRSFFLEAAKLQMSSGLV